jgi:DNA-binding response OmpR family regulator
MHELASSSHDGRSASAAMLSGALIEAAGERPRLLVVDDELSVVLAVKRYFTSIGFEVDTANSLATAGECIAANEYTVVIGDLRLSRNGEEEEGLSVLRRVRELSPSTLYLVLTAFGSAAIERHARELGADEFLQKPSALPEIAAAVLELLKRRNAS